MSLYKEWTKLLKNQTEESFDAFWDSYCEAEVKIYKDILGNKKSHLSGSFDNLVAQYAVDPVLFMGFLDGIMSSLTETYDIDSVVGDTAIELNIDFEKLFYNMLVAEAEHLFGLEEWDNIFTMEERVAINDTFRRSKTVVKDKLPGRNDPCPCGSGKKYKKCCGINQ